MLCCGASIAGANLPARGNAVGSELGGPFAVYVRESGNFRKLNGIFACRADAMLGACGKAGAFLICDPILTGGMGKHFQGARFAQLTVRTAACLQSLCGAGGGCVGYPFLKIMCSDGQWLDRNRIRVLAYGTVAVLQTRRVAGGCCDDHGLTRCMSEGGEFLCLCSVTGRAAADFGAVFRAGRRLRLLPIAKAVRYGGDTFGLCDLLAYSAAFVATAVLCTGAFKIGHPLARCMCDGDNGFCVCCVAYRAYAAFGAGRGTSGRRGDRPFGEGVLTLRDLLNTQYSVAECAGGGAAALLRAGGWWFLL